jgi:hypothetical protein
MQIIGGGLAIAFSFDEPDLTQHARAAISAQ